MIITGGTIEAVNYVATGPKQTLPVAIVGGGVSWSKDTISGDNPPIELTTTTSSSSVVIDGATVKDDIVGGGYAYQTGSTASVENASLSISNATLGSDSNKSMSTLAVLLPTMQRVLLSNPPSCRSRQHRCRGLCTQAVLALTVRSARAARL